MAFTFPDLVRQQEHTPPADQPKCRLSTPLSQSQDSVHLPGVSVLRNPILGNSYSINRSQYPWLNHRRPRATYFNSAQHDRSVFANSHHLMKNIYSISPEWISDKTELTHIERSPRNQHWAWPHAYDLSKSMKPRLRDLHINPDVYVGLSHAEASNRAGLNLAPPAVTPRTIGYKLPAVTNPMGPCLTQVLK